MLSIELFSEAAAKVLPKELRLFAAATSLGSVESLAEWRRQYDQDISPTLVRLSIGLECPEDLQRDFEQAFNKLDLSPR